MKRFFTKNGKKTPITPKKGISSDLQKLEKKSKISKSKYVRPNEFEVKTLRDKLVIKKGLKVDDEHDIMQALFNVWSKTPEDTKKSIKEIRIYEMEKGSNTVGEYDNENDILYLYMASDFDENDYEENLSHELAHSYFKNEYFSKNRDKIVKYADEMELLPPITFYSKRFYDQYVDVERMLGKNPDSRKLNQELADSAYNYVNEEHSETAMYVNAKDKNRISLGIISPMVMKEAVKNYDRLHNS